MGGRGSSSGISVKPYGTEYHTLLESGNIKFVQRNEGNAKAPLETMTKGRVYVTVNAKGELKYISYYDVNKKKVKTIDLDHPHKKMRLHTHHGYEHNENDGPKGATRLTPKEKIMVVKVRELWYNNKGK